MIAIYLDDRTAPVAPRENGWYIMDGTTILLAGPFSSREQALLSIDEQEPDPEPGVPAF
ncbi:hypothetical protein [Gluconacetobacter tumulicola]|uniref:Uncharacterized protein n=1 Tax=Gluconacetobacter tumulicola TaxID=1017177 RepID=A0A7W4JCQ0_9PROT|nr:hypothetical protein [Gluconacetobacter tumulicola]MBB2178831.1 hypothetical protein [Gluconacetobacter tumulicola]